MGIGRRRDLASSNSLCSEKEVGRPVVASSDVCIVGIKEYKVKPI
jgi:hypothetical protein